MSPSKPSMQFKVPPDTLGVDVDEILAESGSLNLLGITIFDRPPGDLIDRNEIHNCIKIKGLSHLVDTKVQQFFE